MQQAVVQALWTEGVCADIGGGSGEQPENLRNLL